MKAFLKRHPVWTVFGGLFLFLALFCFVQLQRPVPAIKVASALPANSSYSDSQLAVPWPTTGSVAVAVGGVGMVGSSRDDRPRPVASLVKAMTAYVVLKDHALGPGDAGQNVDVQQADVDLYKRELANGESVVEVKTGTTLSEVQMLQGLLIPSGNNLAFMLANWNSGSTEAFVKRMNEEAAALGMKDTKYAEPSGVSPASVSTARDQLKLAQAAMADPIFAAIVGQKQATLPTEGVVFNVNSLIGSNNMVGIKTGWTDEAGACFMFAVDQPLAGRTARIFGVVLGQDTLADAFAATKAMLAAVGPGLQVVPIVSKEAPAALLTDPWGGGTSASPTDDVSFVLWGGVNVDSTFQPAKHLKSVKAGDEVGRMVVTAGDQHAEVPVLAKGPMLRAGLTWRLVRLR